MIKRLCSKSGCPHYRLEGSMYCREHDYLRIEKENIDNERNKDRFSRFSKSTLYNSSKWRRISSDFLKRNPYCCVCGRPSQVTDHIIPHRGDEELFWDEGNFQPMCKSCHDNKTKEEIKSRR